MNLEHKDWILQLLPMDLKIKTFVFLTACCAIYFLLILRFWRLFSTYLTQRPRSPVLQKNVSL
jgi:hypothetical protein